MFADIFERDVLTYQQRELATISALAAMKGVEPMLKAHIGMGKNAGLTEREIQEVMRIVEGQGVENLFPLGNRGTSNWFTGEVYVRGLVNPDEIEGLYSVGQVTFEPGGKTHWHTHPIGQVLLVTEGQGFYQERGKPAQELTKGSVVVIPKDVEHWHGASADTKLVHIAISNMIDGSNVIWMNPVNDQELL